MRWVGRSVGVAFGAAKLSHDDRVVLAEALKLKQYKVGSPIVREGEEGHEFFIIKKGKAVVTRKDPESKKEVELGKLNAGDYFGLFHSNPIPHSHLIPHTHTHTHTHLITRLSFLCVVLFCVVFAVCDIYVQARQLY